MRVALGLAALMMSWSAIAQAPPEIAVFRQHLAQASPEERRLIAEVLVACQRALADDAATAQRVANCEDAEFRWKLLFGGDPKEGTPGWAVHMALNDIAFASRLRLLVGNSGAADRNEEERVRRLVVWFTGAFLTLAR